MNPTPSQTVGPFLTIGLPWEQGPVADPHGVRTIPIGTPVVGFDGTLLGRVHEVHPHYLLVGQEGHGEVRQGWRGRR